MRLRRLRKADISRDENDCPAMYLAEDPTMMVGQGKILDVDTTAELRNVAADEGAHLYPTELVLRAAAQVLAENGRPAMVEEVEDFLASTPRGGS